MIFDCDGVLVDSGNLRWILRDLGLYFSAPKRLTTCSSARFSMGCSTSSSAAFTYNWAFATALAFLRELKPVAHVREAIEEFAGRGHPMAVGIRKSPFARVCLSSRLNIL